MEKCPKVKIIMVFYVPLTKRSDTSLLSLLTDVRQLFQQVNIFKVDLPSVLQFASWDFPCIQRYSCGTWNEGTGNEWQLEKGQQDNIWQGLTQIWVSQLTFAYRLPYIASVAYKRMNGVKNYGHQWEPSPHCPTIPKRLIPQYFFSEFSFLVFLLFFAKSW